MANTHPRIGVTRWEDVPGERIEDYWERIEEAGGTAVDLRGSGSIEGLDGLVLTGGYDVEPERYGDSRHPKVKQIDPERDTFELGLLEGALTHGLAVLAICRGSQLLNVAFGGSLLQHIEERSHVADYRAEGYPSQWHEVRLRQGSRVQGIYGATEIEVNSRHHQAVLRRHIAPGLVGTARSADGVIEALESKTHRWVVGLQWHPERLEPSGPHFAAQQKPLFAALVAESAKVGATP